MGTSHRRVRSALPIASDGLRRAADTQVKQSPMNQERFSLLVTPSHDAAVHVPNRTCYPTCIV